MKCITQLLLLYLITTKEMNKRVITTGIKKEEPTTTMDKKSNLVIGTWNKGGKWDTKLNVKVPEIENLLKSQRIDILAIQEANWKQDMDEKLVKIPGYEIVADKGRKNKKRKNSRTVAYIRDDIHFEIQENKMREDTPEIWLRISEPGKRKTDLIIYYREFKKWGSKEERRLSSVRRLFYFDSFDVGFNFDILSFLRALCPLN